MCAAGMGLCEEPQRKSGMVSIRRLQQRCGLGPGARTSREKQHWRLWGLPSAATAYSRMPLSPSPRGTAGHRTSEKTIISTPPSLWIHYQFSARGDLEDKQERTPSVHFDVCVSVSERLQHDSPRLISERLRHHIQSNLTTLSRENTGLMDIMFLESIVNMNTTDV